MKILVRFVLTSLFLSTLAFGQSIPVDFSAGYSYLNFTQPLSSQTPNEQLKLNGWDFSAAFFRFHHLSAEANISGHTLGSCAGNSSTTCNNLSYMFGPRYTHGDRSSRVTFYVHGLVGQDRATLLGEGGNGITAPTVTDTSFAAAGGGGLDFWFMRHVGIQAGPFDYFYTNHLNNSGAPSQGSLRAAGGIAFRFGGDFPAKEPKAPKEPEAEARPKSHRSWKRPWHKTTTAGSEDQTAENRPAPAHKPAPAPSSVPASTPATTRGLAIHSLGVIVAPQEFDGAKVLQIEPGSVAEMASLKPGDMIKSVDGKTVRTPMELAAELADKTGKVRIGLQRGELTVETLVLLGTH